MNNNILTLIRTIGFDEIKRNIVPIESDELYKLAYQNKIALLYLTSLYKYGKLQKLKPNFEKNVLRYNTLFEDVSRLLPAIDSVEIDYAIIKTFRYFPENPNDIDILVFNYDDSKILKLDEELQKFNYLKYTIGNNKYNFNKLGKLGYWDYKRPKNNLKEGDSFNYIDLDFYLELMVEEFVHGNKNHFKTFIEYRDFHNEFNNTILTLKVLSPVAELFYLFFHSIFPTRTLGLELFFSTIHILKRFNESDYETFFNLARKFHLQKEIDECVLRIMNLYKIAFNEENEKLRYLGKRIIRKKYKSVSTDDRYPYIFPFMFFLRAGFMSAMHKKGLISLFFVFLKCINPFYLLNILREVFSKKLTIKRYKSKFDSISA